MRGFAEPMHATGNQTRTVRSRTCWFTQRHAGIRLQTQDIAITNPRGLHVRACARIVTIASRFRSKVSIVVRGRRASARNIVAVMMMTAAVGTTVRLEIEGPDEVEAMREVSALFHDGLGERS